MDTCLSSSPLESLYRALSLFCMHTWMDAKLEDITTEIERVICKTVYAKKLTTQSETNFTLSQKVSQMFSAHMVPDILALSGFLYAYLDRCKAWSVKSL